MKTVLYGPSLLEIIIKDTFFQLLPRVSIAVVINAAVLMCLCVDCSFRHFHNYCYCQWLLSTVCLGLVFENHVALAFCFVCLGLGQRQWKRTA